MIPMLSRAGALDTLEPMHGGKAIVTAQVLSLDCNPAEPNRAASSSADRSLKLWDLQHGRCVRDFVAVHKTCNSLRFSADGQARLLSFTPDTIHQHHLLLLNCSHLEHRSGMT